MDTKSLLRRHAIEAVLEQFRIPIDGVEGKAIQISEGSLRKVGIDFKKFNSFFSASSSNSAISLKTSRLEDAGVLRDWLFENIPNRATWVNHKIPSHINVPKDMDLPRSKQYLDRMYADNFIPIEKKTAVVDLQNSHGPYLASVDDDPLVIFDAASQIASLSDGYRSGSFISALDEGLLTENLADNPDMTAPGALETNPEQAQLLADFKNFVCGKCWDPIKHISFTRGGAEANEKAFQLCRQMGPGGKRVIAFEGSFHGRTTIAMHSTHNPAKRKGFEIEGYETHYSPFPECKDPAHQPDVEDAWIKSWASGNIPDSSGDPLEDTEIQSLTSVGDHIKKGDICCVIIEPMQCEGGDRYATNRFFNGLRALTRGAGIPLVMDEVQTGFGLGGNFFWHNDFKLRDAKGNPDGPDCITIAKRAQIGACLSVIKDKIPSPPHLINVQRGLIQAKAIDAASPAIVEEWIQNQLQKLALEFPENISDPRTKGYAFAFDMNDAESANGLLSKRFELGFMAYIAGSSTLRFRANMSTTKKELDFLFDGLRRGLNPELSSRMQTDRAQTGAAHSSSLSDLATKSSEEYQIQVMSPADWAKHKPKLIDLEKEIFEPERRESEKDLDSWAIMPDALTLLATNKETGDLLGFSTGCPLEGMNIDGCLQDPNYQKNNTFYSVSLVVTHKTQGKGLGKKLKQEQLFHLSQMLDSNGKHRYDYCTGRQRVGAAEKMMAINESLGAYSIATYDSQYAGDGQAVYYRIPLQRPNIHVDSILESGMDGMHEAIHHGTFTTAVGTKLTLSNWATPSAVRYVELLKSIAPAPMNHVYSTSGQDELVDKALRSLKVHRPKAKITMTLTDQFFGNISAAATSLSQHEDPKLNWFNWPKLPHPAKCGVDASLAAIENELVAHPPEEIFAFAVELKGEKSGLEVGDDFLGPLKNLLDTKNIPLIYSETGSALQKTSPALFKTEPLKTKPNMILWFTGGQQGHIFVDDTYYVDKPLTLISTWDGDEISSRRNIVRIAEWMKSK